MTDDPRLEAATREYRRQIESTDEEQRSNALHTAVRAFQSALGLQGAEVFDYLALCELLGMALDEYGGKVEASLEAIH